MHLLGWLVSPAQRMWYQRSQPSHPATDAVLMVAHSLHSQWRISFFAVRRLTWVIIHYMHDVIFSYAFNINRGNNVKCLTDWNEKCCLAAICLIGSSCNVTFLHLVSSCVQSSFHTSWLKHTGCFWKQWHDGGGSISWVNMSRILHGSDCKIG